MAKHGESFGSSGMCPHKRGFEICNSGGWIRGVLDSIQLPLLNLLKQDKQVSESSKMDYFPSALDSSPLKQQQQTYQPCMATPPAAASTWLSGNRMGVLLGTFPLRYHTTNLPSCPLHLYRDARRQRQQEEMYQLLILKVSF